MTTAAPALPTEDVHEPIAEPAFVDHPGVAERSEVIVSEPESGTAVAVPDSPAADLPSLVEHPAAGILLVVVLTLLGCAAASVVTGSLGAGLVLVGVIGGMAAILVAAL